VNKTVRALALATPVVTMALLAAPASAGGQQMEKGQVAAHLEPVPGNGVEGGGYAQVEFDGHGQISQFELQAHGLLPDLPHAAHIHYGEQARHECPGLGDDTNDDGHLNTTEGAPAYGPVQVSLTTSGDTSPASVLAIDRYDTATHGTIAYEREEHIATSAEVAAAIAHGQGVVVVHGVDYDGDGTYGGDVMSDLDPELPTEATDPALCGVLEADHGHGDAHHHGDGHEDRHEDGHGEH
jgi:hypothetical protein